MAIQRYIKAAKLQLIVPDPMDPNRNDRRDYGPIRDFCCTDEGQISHVQFRHYDTELKVWRFIKVRALEVDLTPESEG